MISGKPTVKLYTSITLLLLLFYIFLAFFFKGMGVVLFLRGRDSMVHLVGILLAFLQLKHHQPTEID